MKITDEKPFRIGVLRGRLEALEGLTLIVSVGKEVEKECKGQLRALKGDYNNFLSGEGTVDVCKMFKVVSL